MSAPDLVEAAQLHIQRIRDAACRARETVEASRAQIAAQEADNARLLAEADMADAAADLFAAAVADATRQLAGLRVTGIVLDRDPPVSQARPGVLDLAPYRQAFA